MYQIIIVVHVLLGLGVIGFVLIQHGKGADAGAAFGSASSGSVFGAQGASSFLSRTTAILATLFFATSLGLAILSGNHGKTTDLMEEDIISDVPLVDNTGVTPVPTPSGTSDTPIIDNQQAVTQTINNTAEQLQGTVKQIETTVDKTAQSFTEEAKTLTEGTNP